MKIGAVLAAALVTLTLSGCVEERVCSDGEHPVKPVGAGMGGVCVDDGDPAPDGFEDYPKGQVPEVLGDKWDVYWNEKQLAATRAEDLKAALQELKPAKAPSSWKRTTIGEIGSIAAPATWTVETKGATTRLSEGDAYVEVTLEPDGAKIAARAAAIREEGTEATDPIFDIDTPASWPGATNGHYVRTSRALPDEDDYLDTEALLLVVKDGSLLIVRGTVSENGEDIDGDSISAEILRTLLLTGS